MGEAAAWPAASSNFMTRSPPLDDLEMQPEAAIKTS
jgi:hypothetical protein